MGNINLVPAIKVIEQEIINLKIEYSKKLCPYEESLRYLRKINKCCENCNGVGKILRSRVCAEDDRPNENDPRDYITCPVCRGSGLSMTGGVK